MVRKGYAKIDDVNFVSIPKHVKKKLQEAQDYAAQKLNGIWKLGGEFENHDDY